MREDLKSLFRTLLVRKEQMDYTDPAWIARWIEIKLNLLTCLDTVANIKRIMKENIGDKKYE